MNIRIDRTSDVPLHEQIAAQIVFLIGSGALKAGAPLPSVRALAHRLGLHRNTISRAYQHRVLNLLASKHAGRRLAVRSSEPATLRDARDLDAFVAATLLEAGRRGYSVRQVHERLVARLNAEPPDHLLTIAEDAGMRMLLATELASRFNCRVDSCPPDEATVRSPRAVGALIVSPPAHLPALRASLPANHPVVAIRFSSVDAHLRTVVALTKPSLIGVASVSAYVIEMALAVLAPAIGPRHSVRGYLMKGPRPERPGAADLLLCDVLTYPILRARGTRPSVVVYRLIADECLEDIAEAMGARSSNRVLARPRGNI